MGGFPSTMDSSGGVSQMGYVPSCKEDPAKVVSWPVVAWIDLMEARKMVV